MLRIVSGYMRFLKPRHPSPLEPVHTHVHNIQSSHTQTHVYTHAHVRTHRHARAASLSHDPSAMSICLAVRALALTAYFATGTTVLLGLVGSLDVDSDIGDAADTANALCPVDLL